MGKNYVESSLKRFFKRKVKITKYINFAIWLSGKNLKIIKFRSTKKLIVKSAF